MQTVYNAGHAAHAATHEFFRGRLVPAFETPARADYILQALQTAGLGELLAPVDHGRAPLERVHTTRYLRFVESAHAEWLALGGEGDAFPAVWPVRTLRSDIEPASFAARMGLYSMDSGTPLTAGSWTAAYAGAQASLTALDLVLAGQRSAYCLTRPPGHHAGADFFGGYCFINNVAVAAQAARDAGLARVAILDVDYHHGNGTQAIFYDRADVFFASVHGDPRTEYPFFLGHADETGSGAGAGFNANFPLLPRHRQRGLVCRAGAGARAADGVPPGTARRVAGRGHLRRRPDLAFQAGRARVPRDGPAPGRVRRADTVHPGRRLCDRGHRPQCRGRAARLRSRMTTPTLALLAAPSGWRTCLGAAGREAR